LLQYRAGRSGLKGISVSSGCGGKGPDIPIRIVSLSRLIAAVAAMAGGCSSSAGLPTDGGDVGPDVAADFGPDVIPDVGRW